MSGIPTKLEFVSKNCIGNILNVSIPQLCPEIEKYGSCDF